MKRACGDCQLCCKLVPVRDLGKSANQRCQHQRRGKKRCSIYGDHPISCKLWSCRWLEDEATASLSRPDRSHYVIDVMTDYIGRMNNATGERVNLPVIQVWVDPKFPDAHRDPALRQYMERGSHVAIVRYGSRDGFLLIPPQFVDSGQWWERPVQPGDKWEEEHRACAY